MITLNNFDLKEKAIQSIEQFVKTTCGDRPPTHNHLHMYKVRDNARWIFTWTIIYYYLMVGIIALILNGFGLISLSTSLILETICCTFIAFNEDALIFMVTTVTLLHDVADHKYVEEDSSLTAKLNDFLSKFTLNFDNQSIVSGTVFYYLFNPVMIINIIERISFSRQKKYGTSKWNSTLGIWGVLVRNIVSDADKFEAIGIEGLDRCKDYTIESFVDKKIEFTTKMVKDNVVQHYHDKLKLLASSEYMKTLPGWIYAQKLNRDMQSYISSFTL